MSATEDMGADMALEACPTISARRCDPSDHAFEQVCDATGHWATTPCLATASAPVYACTEAKHRCVDTGWAQWSYATPPPNPRFTTVSDATGAGEDIVEDNWTGLSWQLKHPNVTYTWGTVAQAYCDGLVYGGFSDWRLPSPTELETLVDRTAVPGSAPTVQAPFVAYTQAVVYWTSTPVAGGANSAWSVDFSNGPVNNYPESYTFRVRCVR
jgi:hypothetical protein